MTQALITWLQGLLKRRAEAAEAALEAEALWDQNTGEPGNEAARELCRRWGETWLLDIGGRNAD